MAIENEKTEVNKETSLKKKLYKNASVSLIAQLGKLVLQFALQRVFINTLGAEFLGYNSVFKNILQMLNMADLGVGVAITGYLYGPLADNDHDRVSALMQIYRKVYHVIGIFVAILGAGLTLVLPWIIPDATCGYGYLRILFIINLISVLCTYFLAYKRTLLIANQLSYYRNTVDLATEIIGTIAQVIFLLLVPNYVIYLVINISKTLVANIIINIECHRKYKRYIERADETLVNEYKSTIGGYIGDVFVSRVGAFIFSGTDNIVISALMGSLQAGFLSNYTLVSTGIKGFITQILSAIQATYGNYVTREPDKVKCRQMTDNYIYVDYVVANVCMICCILLFQPFVKVYLGSKYVLEASTAVLLSVNLNMTILMIIPSQIFSVYKLFKYEKCVVMISAVLNIIISVILVNYCGINGALIGTTITSVVYLLSRLYIVSKWVFKIPFTHYLGKLILYTVISFVSTMIIKIVARPICADSWMTLLLLAVGIGALSLFLTLLLTIRMKEQQFLLVSFLKISRKRYTELLLGLFIIGVCSLAADYFIWGGYRSDRLNNPSEKIYSTQSYTLPYVDTEDGKVGFTCTGLTFDEVNEVWWIGCYGRTNEDEEYGHSRIIEMDRDFEKILNVLDISSLVEGTKDNIQGVAYDNSNNSLWFTDSHILYNITSKGELLKTIEFEAKYKKPNGIAVDNKNDLIWVLFFNDYLVQVDKNGKIIKEYPCNIEDQDQLFINQANGTLLFTAGADYMGNENFIYEYDFANECPVLVYQLMDSYAVEGLVVDHDTIYVANDGLYHAAFEPINVIKKYEVN